MTRSPVTTTEPEYQGECWVCGGKGSRKLGPMQVYLLPDPIPPVNVHAGSCKERLVQALTGGLYAVAGCYERDGQPAKWLAARWKVEAGDGG